jgi:hypothetical protein
MKIWNAEKLIMGMTLLVLPVASQAQSSIAGDWQGSLDVGGSLIHITMHIAAGKDGSLSALIDNPDQGVMNVPATSITQKDSDVTIAVDNFNGVYQGKINADATEINGTWNAGQPVEMNFRKVPAKAAEVPLSPPQPPKMAEDTPKAIAATAGAPGPAAPSDIDGAWLGSLDAGGTKLRLVLKIVNTADGLTASLQSPDQSTQWIPASSVSRTGSVISVTFTPLDAKFEGKIAGDSSSIDGTFTQRGNSMALVVKR